MPKILRVRAAHDEKEEKQVRKLAGSRHWPADWILHARILEKQSIQQDDRHRLYFGGEECSTD
jgi:hypothetical protein